MGAASTVLRHRGLRRSTASWAQGGLGRLRPPVVRGLGVAPISPMRSGVASQGEQDREAGEENQELM